MLFHLLETARISGALDRGEAAKVNGSRQASKVAEGMANAYLRIVSKSSSGMCSVDMLVVVRREGYRYDQVQAGLTRWSLDRQNAYNGRSTRFNDHGKHQYASERLYVWRRQMSRVVVGPFLRPRYTFDGNEYNMIE